MLDDKKYKIPIKETVFQINFVKLTFYLFLLFVFIFAVYSAIYLIQAVIIAFIISYIINPIVAYFERKQVPRIFVIIVIFLIIILIIISLIILIKTFFPSQKEIVDIKLMVIDKLGRLKILLSNKYNFIDWEQVFEILIKKVNTESSITEKIPDLLSSLAGMFSLIIIIPFCIFFFLLNGREMKKGFLTVVPNRYFEMSLITIAEVDNIFGEYIRGTLLECLIVGVFTSFGFFIIGFPITTAIITGIIAGFVNAIPYIGPLFGAIIGVAICVLDLIPMEYHTPIIGLHASIFGVFIVVATVQLIDNVVIKPGIIGKSVNLHPLLVILGVMAGSKLFGFVGMVIAIPVIAIIKVVIQTLYKQLKGFQFLSDNIFKVVTKSISEIK